MKEDRRGERTERSLRLRFRTVRFGNGGPGPGRVPLGRGAGAASRRAFARSLCMKRPEEAPARAPGSASPPVGPGPLRLRCSGLPGRGRVASGARSPLRLGRAAVLGRRVTVSVFRLAVSWYCCLSCYLFSSYWYSYLLKSCRYESNKRALE